MENITNDKINHDKLYKAFLEKSNILDVYEFIGGDKNRLISQSNGEFSGLAVWRNEKNKSASFNPDKDLVNDFADGLGYNSYSLLKQHLNSKDEVYKAMCSISGLNINDYYYNKSINPVIEIKVINPTLRQISPKNIEILKQKRNIDFHSLNDKQKDIFKEDEKGNICLLPKMVTRQ
jgi:hypothetical protein